MGKFEVKVRKNGDYQFNLKAGNGEVILSSQGYKAKNTCLNGIESVKKNSADSTKFELLQAKNGKFYFNLKATNGQIIGTSQMYASQDTAKNGIASVQRNAPEAKVVEVEPETEEA